MMSKLTIEPSKRSRRLSYYHENKELMNLQSFVNKLNKNEGHKPLYAYIKAYQLYKDETGKWYYPDCVKEEMKALSKVRLAAEAAAKSATQSTTHVVENQ